VEEEEPWSSLEPSPLGCPVGTGALPVFTKAGGRLRQSPALKESGREGDRAKDGEEPWCAVRLKGGRTPGLIPVARPAGKTGGAAEGGLFLPRPLGPASRISQEFGGRQKPTRVAGGKRKGSVRIWCVPFPPCGFSSLHFPPFKAAVAVLLRRRGVVCSPRPERRTGIWGSVWFPWWSSRRLGFGWASLKVSCFGVLLLCSLPFPPFKVAVAILLRRRGVSSPFAAARRRTGSRGSV